MIRRTPLKRTPMKRKRSKPRPDADPAYLAWIRALPCAVFSNWLKYEEDKFFRGCNCVILVEAHHAGDHGYGQKAPDRTAIPLCVFHHRTGPEAVHVLGKNFWKHHGIDRDALIAELNARYEAECSHSKQA